MKKETKGRTKKVLDLILRGGGQGHVSEHYEGKGAEAFFVAKALRISEGSARYHLNKLANEGLLTKTVRKEWDSVTTHGRSFGGAVVCRRRRAYYKPAKEGRTANEADSLTAEEAAETVAAVPEDAKKEKASGFEWREDRYDPRSSWTTVETPAGPISAKTVERLASSLIELFVDSKAVGLFNRDEVDAALRERFEPFAYVLRRERDGEIRWLSPSGGWVKTFQRARLFVTYARAYKKTSYRRGGFAWYQVIRVRADELGAFKIDRPEDLEEKILEEVRKAGATSRKSAISRNVVEIRVLRKEAGIEVVVRETLKDLVAAGRLEADDEKNNFWLLEASKVGIELDTEEHHDGRKAYHASLAMPYPAGVNGCPLGRSFESFEAAFADLRSRVRAESSVELPVLEACEISARPVMDEVDLETVRKIKVEKKIDEADRALFVEGEERDRLGRIFSDKRRATSRAAIAAKLTKDDELEAVVAFMDDHQSGSWKTRLSLGWQRAAFPGPLQRLRNRLGPEWLEKVSGPALREELDRRRSARESMTSKTFRLPNEDYAIEVLEDRGAFRYYSAKYQGATIGSGLFDDAAKIIAGHDEARRARRNDRPLFPLEIRKGAWGLKDPRLDDLDQAEHYAMSLVDELEDGPASDEMIEVDLAIGYELDRRRRLEDFESLMHRESLEYLRAKARGEIDDDGNALPCPAWVDVEARRRRIFLEVNRLNLGELRTFLEEHEAKREARVADAPDWLAAKLAAMDDAGEGETAPESSKEARIPSDQGAAPVSGPAAPSSREKASPVGPLERARIVLYYNRPSRALVHDAAGRILEAVSRLEKVPPMDLAHVFPALNALPIRSLDDLAALAFRLDHLANLDEPPEGGLPWREAAGTVLEKEAVEPDAQCSACGHMYYSGESGSDSALCPTCFGRHE